MALNSPTIYTEIDATNYEYEINANFRWIQRFMIDAENEINALVGAVPASTGTNLVAIDVLIGDDGMLGTDSWQISWDDATDDFSVIVSHPTTNNGYSYAVISGRIHRSNTQSTTGLEAIVPAGAGNYRITVGLQSTGFPECTVVVDHAEDATDESGDLTLWSFTAQRTAGGAIEVANLRREASVVAARSSWDDIWDREVTINFGVEGTLGGSPANLQPGFVMPWDGKIIKAYCNLGTAPSGSSLVVKLRKDETDEDVLAASFTWGDGVNGVQEAAGNDPETLVAAGTFLQAEMTTANASAADLSVTVLVRPIYHTIT